MSVTCFCRCHGDYIFWAEKLNKLRREKTKVSVLFSWEMSTAILYFCLHPVTRTFFNSERADVKVLSTKLTTYKVQSTRGKYHRLVTGFVQKHHTCSLRAMPMNRELMTT